MTAGSTSYEGLAVPLNGESTIQQVTGGTDILTLQRISGGTGNFVNLLDNGGTSLYKVSSAGAVTATGVSSTANITLTTGKHIRFGAVTTAPTTGLLKGEFMVAFASATTARLGVCVSTASQAMQWIRLRSNSLASTTV